MALEYKPSGLIPKSKTEALANPLSQEVQGLPNTILAIQQMKQQKAKHELEMAKTLFELSKMRAEAGSGAAAPMIPGTITPGTVTPGVGGPEEQQLGATATPLTIGPSTPAPETAGEYINRQGTLASDSESKRITAQADLLKASREKPEGRYQFQPSNGKYFMNGKEIDPTSIPAGAVVDHLAPEHPPLSQRDMAAYKKQITSLTSARDTLRQLQTAWAAIEEQGKTGLSWGTLKSAATGAAEQDPDVTKYNALRDALVVQIGKNVGGDVGNFTAQEQKRYSKTMPSRLANPETAKALFTQLEQLSATKIKDLNESYGITKNDVVVAPPKTQSPALHNAALDWANAHPNDPRATAVKAKAMKEGKK